jgi:hypothetical protein
MNVSESLKKFFTSFLNKTDKSTAEVDRLAREAARGKLAEADVVAAVKTLAAEIGPEQLAAFESRVEIVAKYDEAGKLAADFDRRVAVVIAAHKKRDATLEETRRLIRQEYEQFGIDNKAFLDADYDLDQARRAVRAREVIECEHPGLVEAKPVNLDGFNLTDGAGNSMGLMGNSSLPHRAVTDEVYRRETERRQRILRNAGIRTREQNDAAMAKWNRAQNAAEEGRGFGSILAPSKPPAAIEAPGWDDLVRSNRIAEFDVPEMAYAARADSRRVVIEHSLGEPAAT